MHNTNYQRKTANRSPMSQIVLMDSSKDAEDEVIHEKAVTLGGPDKREGLGVEPKSELLFDAAELILEQERAYYGSRLDVDDPLSLSDVSYNQVNLIPIVMTANYQKIWDFCVGYAAVAMGRKGTADDTITIASGQIGLFYFAAVTLFYSIYECTVGAIPPLQRISLELRDLFQAIAPVNKNGRAYSTTWAQDIDTLIKNLPYNSFTNSSITLAPHTATENAQGQILLLTTIPNITLDDVLEVGPDAFEKVQRYFLANKFDQMKLVSYTMDGPWYFNTSAFPVTRSTSMPTPIRGVTQVLNEVSLPVRDHWLIMLGFFNSGSDTKREGWTAKTVQQGTHLALYRILKGASETAVDKLANKALVHMINYNLAMSQDLGAFVSADFNSATDDTIKDLDDSLVVDHGYLSQITAGEYLTYSLSCQTRRFWLASALCAGTPMPDANSTVIGAGSAYLTKGQMDNVVGFMGTIEDMAANSSFLENGVLQIPVLTMRGPKQTVDPVNPGSSSALYYLNELYPSTVSAVPKTYDFLPYTTGLTDTLDLTYNALAPVCFTQGSTIKVAIDIASSIISSLQANVIVGSATGSRDGPRTKHLWLTHYMNGPADPVGYDVSVSLNVVQLLSTEVCNPREMATVLTRFFPVMFGNLDSIGAYQAIYGRCNAVEVDLPYLEYRGPTIMSCAHKRAANMLSPAEQEAHVFHDVILGEGGNFIDMFFKNGNWVSAAENIAAGLGSLISPQFGKKVKGVVGKAGKAIHEAFKSNKIHSAHYAPISHGFISLNDYTRLMTKLDSLNARKRAIKPALKQRGGKKPLAKRKR